MSMTQLEYAAALQAAERDYYFKRPGWINWYDAPPRANTPVMVMYYDGRVYGPMSFECPEDAWFPPISKWCWRLALPNPHNDLPPDSALARMARGELEP